MRTRVHVQQTHARGLHTCKRCRERQLVELARRRRCLASLRVLALALRLSWAAHAALRRGHCSHGATLTLITPNNSELELSWSCRPPEISELELSWSWRTFAVLKSELRRFWASTHHNSRHNQHVTAKPRTQNGRRQASQRTPRLAAMALPPPRVPAV